ncbi:hypothetical protein AAY473_038527 [Plecturocebus cupreus]
MPVIPATQQAEAGESLEPERSRDWVSLGCPGWSAVAIHRRNSATDQHGSFDLLCFRPGPVHPFLGNLVVPRSRETGFHHVGQAGLELLTSSDPPALASKVLGLQEFEISLASISTKNTKINCAWWHVPVIPATQEAKAQSCFNPGDTSRSVTQAGVQWCNPGSLSLHLPGPSDPPTSASLVAGTTGMYHHAQIINGVYVAQAGLKLLSSSHFPASASQSAGISGRSHHAWLSPVYNYTPFSSFPTAVAN